MIDQYTLNLWAIAVALIIALGVIIKIFFLDYPNYQKKHGE